VTVEYDFVDWAALFLDISDKIDRTAELLARIEEPFEEGWVD
jgi:hypothetical protein